MNRKVTMTLIGLGLACAAGTALAQTPAAESEGWKLIRKYCAGCHEVRPHPQGQRGADGAPGFAALASDPVKGTPEHLRSVLGGPHSDMPPHRFSSGDIDAIIHYFQALRVDARPMK